MGFRHNFNTLGSLYLDPLLSNPSSNRHDVCPGNLHHITSSIACGQYDQDRLYSVPRNFFVLFLINYQIYLPNRTKWHLNLENIVGITHTYIREYMILLFAYSRYFKPQVFFSLYNEHQNVLWVFNFHILSGIFFLSLISFLSELLISKFRSARSSLRLLASAYANFPTNPKAFRNSSNWRTWPTD